MSLFKETEKPFEKFVRYALYLWLGIAVVVGLLVLTGLIKRSGTFPASRTVSSTVDPTRVNASPPEIYRRD